MKTTKEPCIVLEFSGAQSSPHCYSNDKDGTAAGKALPKRAHLSKHKKLDTAAGYLQSSGWSELVLVGQ